MADQPQAAQQAAQPPQQAAPRPGPPAAPKKSFVAKMASAVASHAYLSLAVIVVLVILVIGLYVYYHGFLFLGPYASGGKGGFRSKKKKDEGGGDPGSDEKGDPETERLIDTINRQ